MQLFIKKLSDSNAVLKNHKVSLLGTNVAFFFISHIFFDIFHEKDSFSCSTRAVFHFSDMFIHYKLIKTHLQV